MLRTASLTTEHRAMIQKLHAAGMSKSAIARQLGLTWSAVRSTITNLDDFAPREEVVATVKVARFEPTPVRPVRPTAPADPELVIALRQWTNVKLDNLARALR